MVWLTLIAALAIATGLRAHLRSRAAEAAYPAEGARVTVGGRAVHYVQEGQGPDVVLIHGSMGSTRDMSFTLLPALVAAGFRVTAFDRPGLGYSDRLARRGVTLADQAAQLAAASRALGLVRPVVVGQSYGGAVAMAWALEHPGDLSAVVSLSGATHPWEGSLDLSYRILSWPVIGWLAAQVVAAWLPTRRLEAMLHGVFAPEPAPEGFAAHFGPRLNLAPHRLCANAQQRTDLRAHLIPQATRYRNLTLPVEVIHGEADTIVGITIHAEKLAREAPKGQLTRLPGVGHMPHHTATAACVEVISRAALRAGTK